MNRDELSKMLDLVDEKYLNEALGNGSADGTATITAVKRRSIGSEFACIAAALALVIGLTLLTNPKEISVDEGQGAVTDSETVTDIIEPDETENEPYDYGELFSSPADLGRRDFFDRSYEDTLCDYDEERVRDMFPDKLSALMSVDFDTRAKIAFNDSGEVSSANISLISSDNYLYQFNITMSKNGGLWDGFYYAGKTERLGKTVYSCYCEKTDGLHLWAYFENEGTAFVLYSIGFERGETALILDGLITGSVSFDGFTPDNANSVRQDLTAEQVAALPEFKGKFCSEKVMGGMILRDEKLILIKMPNKYKTSYESAFCAVYEDISDRSRSVFVTYCTEDNEAAAAVTDIDSVTPEMIAEWSRSGEFDICINADGVYVEITGKGSALFLEALTDHLKADSD